MFVLYNCSVHCSVLLCRLVTAVVDCFTGDPLQQATEGDSQHSQGPAQSPQRSRGHEPRVGDHV